MLPFLHYDENEPALRASGLKTLLRFKLAFAVKGQNAYTKYIRTPGHIKCSKTLFL